MVVVLVVRPLHPPGPSEGCVPRTEHFLEAQKHVFVTFFLVVYRLCALLSVRRPRVLAPLLLDPGFSSKETTGARFGADGRWVTSPPCPWVPTPAPTGGWGEPTRGRRLPRPPPPAGRQTLHRRRMLWGLGCVPHGGVPWQCTVICKLASSL